MVTDREGGRSKDYPGVSHYAELGARLFACGLRRETWLRNFLIRTPAPVKKLALRGLMKWVSFRSQTWSSRPNRILGVWNFNVQTGSIGDCLAFHEVLNVLCDQCGAQKVDVCYIDDPSHPNTKNPIYARSPIFKKCMKDTALVNPRLGAVFDFDSDTEFEVFLKNSFYRYLRIWPDVSRGEVAYDVRIIDHFFRQNRYLPRFSCRPEVTNWALDFITAKVSPSLPITVGFRNKKRMPSINSDINCWGKFFEHFTKDQRYKFIVVCYKEEVIEALRQFENVLIAKDYGTDFEQDCALIQASHACVSQTNGILNFPIFAGIPTLSFGHNYTHPTFYALEDYGSWGFLTQFQKQFWGTPDPKLIIKEFSQLMDMLADAGWVNPTKQTYITASNEL